MSAELEVRSRYQYTKGELKRNQSDPESPFITFNLWFNEASLDLNIIPEPGAVTLSTAELPSGRISARMVILKKVDSKGFIIYSNFGTSR